MQGDVSRAMNSTGVSFESLGERVSPTALAELLRLVADGEINRNTAKRVFQEAFASGRAPSEIVAAEGFVSVSDEGAIAAKVAEVLAANAEMVERYRAGEQKVFGALMGAAMKAFDNQADPKTLQRLLREALGG